MDGVFQRNGYSGYRWHMVEGWRSNRGHQNDSRIWSGTGEQPSIPWTFHFIRTYALYSGYAKIQIRYCLAKCAGSPVFLQKPGRGNHQSHEWMRLCFSRNHGNPGLQSSRESFPTFDSRISAVEIISETPVEQGIEITTEIGAGTIQLQKYGDQLIQIHEISSLLEVFFCRLLMMSYQCLTGSIKYYQVQRFFFDLRRVLNVVPESLTGASQICQQLFPSKTWSFDVYAESLNIDLHPWSQSAWYLSRIRMIIELSSSFRKHICSHYLKLGFPDLCMHFLFLITTLLSLVVSGYSTESVCSGTTSGGVFFELFLFPSDSLRSMYGMRVLNHAPLFSYDLRLLSVRCRCNSLSIIFRSISFVLTCLHRYVASLHVLESVSIAGFPCL